MFNKKKTKNKKEAMKEYNAIKAKIFGNESKPKYNHQISNTNNNNHYNNHENNYISKRYNRATSSTLPKDHNHSQPTAFKPRNHKPQRPRNGHSHSSNPSNYSYNVTQRVREYNKTKTKPVPSPSHSHHDPHSHPHKYGTYIHTAHEEIYKNTHATVPNNNYKKHANAKYDHKSSGKWKAKPNAHKTPDNEYQSAYKSKHEHQGRHSYSNNKSHRSSHYKSSYHNPPPPLSPPRGRARGRSHGARRPYRGRGGARRDYRSPPPAHKQYNIFLTPRAQRTADAVLEQMKHFNKEEAVDDWWKETETQPITPLHHHNNDKPKHSDNDNDATVSSESVEKETHKVNKSQIEQYLARQKAQKMMNQYHVPVAPVKLQETPQPVDEAIIAAVCDKLQRKAWGLGSAVSIFSVSAQAWFVGKIIKISAAVMDGKWKLGSLCRIYSLSQHKWRNGKVIDISFDAAGQWLKIKYRGYCKKLLLTDEDDMKYLEPVGDDICGEWLTVFYDKKEKIISRHDEYIRGVAGDVDEALRERALQYLAENPRNLDSDEESVENRKLAMQSVKAILKDASISLSQSPVVNGGEHGEGDGGEREIGGMDVMQTDLSMICWEYNSLTGCKKGSKCKWKHEYVNGEIKHPEVEDGTVEEYKKT